MEGISPLMDGGEAAGRKRPSIPGIPVGEEQVGRRHHEELSLHMGRWPWYDSLLGSLTIRMQKAVGRGGYSAGMS